jgi:basic amino acid/polyamine antiporter, APA family
VSALLIFIALGLTLGAGSGSNLVQGAAPVAAGAWLLALIPVMFTYSGWNAAAYVAEEIHEPGRNVPRALALGTLAVVAIYVLLNLLFLYVLPVNELAQVRGSVLDVVADRLLGIRAGDVMGIVSIISIAASISAMTFAGPRVYYAMARDGLFFRGAAKIHPKYQTPAASIVAQAVWSGLLVLSGGANALTTYTGFAVVLFSGIAVVSLFVLRQREPDAPRPFRAWGYPIAPAIFATASLAIVLNALWVDGARRPPAFSSSRWVCRSIFSSADALPPEGGSHGVE